MSYGLRVYLVDTSELLCIPGSGDSELLEEILESRADTLEEYDEEADPFGDDYDPPFSHAEALHEIFAGKLSRSDCGSYYGWAFDLLCAYLGDWMHKWCDRWPTTWLSQLDKIMAEGHVELQISDDLIGRSPIPLLNDLDAIPGIGHWTHERVVTALPNFEKLLLQVEDSEVLHSLEQEMLPWLRASADRPGSMLVGVYG